MVPVEKKTRIVLSVLAGGTALVAGRSGSWFQEGQLGAEVVESARALGEAHLGVWVWKKSVEGRLGSSGTLR